MNQMLTQKEVADILGISVHSVTALIDSGKLLCYRINSRTFRIPASAVQAFLEGCQSTQDVELSKAILAEQTN
ncbi:MAG TPA: helix-turn-helix domain-containing protein [Pirellula sp.]|nr:helix-turn-helix domain-containing protein [Pirellula sp.]